jgi:hypothetical protein
MNKFRKVFLPFAVILAVGSGAALADEAVSAKVELNGSAFGLSMSGSQGDSKTTVSISGPDGFYRTTQSDMDFQDIDLASEQALADGIYQYEIVINSGAYREVKDTLNNGRGENNVTLVPKTKVQKGHFWVVNGQIKSFKKVKEPSVMFQGRGK